MTHRDGDGTLPSCWGAEKSLKQKFAEDPPERLDEPRKPTKLQQEQQQRRMMRKLGGRGA